MNFPVLRHSADCRCFLSLSLLSQMRRNQKIKTTLFRFGIIATSVRLLFKYLSSCMYATLLCVVFLFIQRSLSGRRKKNVLALKFIEKEKERERYLMTMKNLKGISQTLAVLFHRCRFCCYMLLSVRQHFYDAVTSSLPY